MIKIRIEIASVPAGTQAGVIELLTPVGQLEGTKVSIATPNGGPASLIAEMVVGASPLSAARQSVFEREIQRLQQVAAAIQARQSGAPLNKSALDEKYAAVSSFLARIPGVEIPSGSAIRRFVETVADYLESGLTVAAHSPTGLELQYATAAVAAEAERRGFSLARFTPGILTFKMIPSIIPRAPGWLAVSALQLASGSDSYQVADDAAVALGQLRRQGSPLFVTGTFEELQNVFARGQGLRANPLEPLVQPVPRIETASLAEFAVSAAAPHGGLTRAAEAEVTKAVMAAASGLPRADALRVLQPVARQALQRWKRGALQAGVGGFAGQLAGERATLAGFAVRESSDRCEEFQARLLEIALALDPVAFLRADLLGQGAALTEIGARLRKEILTRPRHQPIRWIAQGPPGTGKSESLKLLAQFLGLHHEFIDASAFSDAYTAASQLFGSARGLVGSNRPGRLEQAAKHRPGVLVEIADLDHAAPTVRATVADLCLKSLDVGYGDSAIGTPFGLANVLLVFTVNVERNDELRRGIGFNAKLSREEITTRTMRKLVTEFSPAFIDRVGSPIVFEPLDNSTLAAIAQREAVSSFRRAAECVGHPASDVRAANDLGKSLVRGFQRLTTNPGARGLKEHVGQQVAEAAALWHRAGRSSGPFYLKTNEEGKILIENRGG